MNCDYFKGNHRVNILGVGISAVNMERALQVMEGWILRGEKQYVCVANVHSVMESQRDQALLRIMNRSGLSTPDGMPLVWLCRRAGHRQVSRVYGPDLLLAFSDLAARAGYRFFFYGGSEGVAEELAERLRNRFPGLNVAGTYSPPFRKLTTGEKADVVAMINDSRADVVWVGLGAPKQERWMAEYRLLLKAPVLVGVGAAFDFHAGRIKQAPSWMQRCGLEWFFRLIQEPKRLWRRYLFFNPLFALLVLLQAVRITNYADY